MSRLRVSLVILMFMISIVGTVVADTIIVYPSVDGYAVENTDETFILMRNDTGDGMDYTATAAGTNLKTTATPAQFTFLRRPIFVFNTSLPTGSTVTGARLVLNGGTKTNEFAEIPQIVITGGSTASNTTIANGDYALSTQNEYAARLSYNDFNIGNSDNYFTITNLSSINKIGNSTFFVRTSWDVDNTSPTWADTKQMYVSINTIENVNPSIRSYLEITYTPPAAAPVAAFYCSAVSGNNPLSVTCYDSSTNAPSAWNWYNNSTLVSTDQNPALVLNGNGFHDIKLNASNDLGYSWSNKTSYIWTSNNVTPITNFTTTGLLVNGSIDFANQTPWGTILYTVWTNAASGYPGAAEVEPVSRTTIWSWIDTTWVDGRGPESLERYSNGNYLLSDVDAHNSVYEMAPNNTKIWEYAATYSSCARMETIDGVDAVILYDAPDHAIKVIRRDNQSVMKTFTGFNYTNNGDYRVIGGQKYIITADFKAPHSIYVINYDTGAIVLNHSVAVSSGPFSVEWINDNLALYTYGAGNTAGLLDTSSNTTIWTSSALSGTTIYATLFGGKILVSDNTPVIKVLDYPTLISPVAAFTATVSGATVTFIDGSTNTPSSWIWQYNQHEAPGWVQFSTSASPSYNFVEGTYDINLTATNAAGSDSEVKTSFIVVSSGDEGTVFPDEPTGYEEAKARYASDNDGMITAMILIFLVAAIVGVAIAIKCIREGITDATFPLIVGYFIGVFILVIVFAAIPAFAYIGEV